MRPRLPTKGLMEIGNWGNLYTRDLPHSNIFLPSEYHLFYLDVNLMPYGFLLFIQTDFPEYSQNQMPDNQTLSPSQSFDQKNRFRFLVFVQSKIE